MNIVNLHIGKYNLCCVAYIYNGEKREKREREERERRRDSTLQDHAIYNKMRIALCVYPTIFPWLTPWPQLSQFFTRISRRRYVVLRRLCL